MAKYAVIFDKDVCIGAAACVAVDGANWALNDEGKADLKGAEELEKNVLYKRMIEKTELAKFKEAETHCPVKAIRVEVIE